MFGDNELKTTKKYIKRKMQDVLDNTKGSDADYIKTLQILILLENSVDREMDEND